MSRASGDRHTRTVGVCCAGAATTPWSASRRSSGRAAGRTHRRHPVGQAQAAVPCQPCARRLPFAGAHHGPGADAATTSRAHRTEGRTVLCCPPSYPQSVDEPSRTVQPRCVAASGCSGRIPGRRSTGCAGVPAERHSPAGVDYAGPSPGMTGRCRTRRSHVRPTLGRARQGSNCPIMSRSGMPRRPRQRCWQTCSRSSGSASGQRPG